MNRTRLLEMLVLMLAERHAEDRRQAENDARLRDENDTTSHHTGDDHDDQD